MSDIGKGFRYQGSGAVWPLAGVTPLASRNNASLSHCGGEVIVAVPFVWPLTRADCGLRASKPLVGALGEAHVVLGNNLAVVGDNSLKFCGCRMPNAEEPGAGVDDISGRPVRNVA